MRQSLGGTNGLRQDALAKLRLDGGAGDKVDRASKHLRQATPQAGKLEQRDGPGKVNQQVDIAAGPGLSARRGAKQKQALGSQRLPILARRLQSTNDLSLVHGCPCRCLSCHAPP